MAARESGNRDQRGGPDTPFWNPPPGYRRNMHRTGRLIFGIAAIVAGVSIGIAAAMGWDAPPVVLILITLVVIGCAIYYWIWIRPAPYGVERRNHSESHEPD